MKLTLDKVHRLMGQVLGAEAVTLQNHVGRVCESEELCGITIQGNGTLVYSPGWWNETVDTPEKAKHVIMFEIMKKVLGADRRHDDWIAKIAAGAVINAYLYAAFGFHQLPRAMYSAIDLPECLMRPGSRGFHSRLRSLYRKIWKRESRMTEIGNVDRALRILFRDASIIPDHIDPNDIEVLGYVALGGGDSQGEGSQTTGDPSEGRMHGGDPMSIDHTVGERGIENLPADVLEHMAKGVESKCKTAGFSTQANDFVMKRMKQNKTLETIMIEDFAMDKIKKKVRKHFDGVKPDVSVLPLRISQRDALKLALDIPIFWFEDETEDEKESGGLAIYMDVSGSFHSFIPYTLGVVQCVGDMVEEMYQFSNQVHPISFEEIQKQDVKIVSTGGTDFDCIVRHAVSKDYDKVLIITDGWADVNNEKCRALASEHIKDVLVILVLALPGPDGTIANPRCMERSQKEFLENTWLGQRYGACCDLSEAFK